MSDVLEWTLSDDAEPPVLVELGATWCEGVTWCEDFALSLAEDLELTSREEFELAFRGELELASRKELEATGPESATDVPLGRLGAGFAGVEAVRGAGSGAGAVCTDELSGAGSGPGAARAGDTAAPNAPATNRTAATSPILPCRRLTIALRTTCAAPGRPRAD